MSDTESVYFGATERIPRDVPFFGFTELKATTTQVHLQLVQDLDSVVMMYLFDFFFLPFLLCSVLDYCQILQVMIKMLSLSTKS